MDLEVQLGVLVVHQAQDVRQQIGRDRGDHAEPEHSGERRPYRFGLLHQLTDRVQHRPGPGGEPLTGGRQQHLAGRALDELDTQCLLQRGDGSGECRLTHPD